ncbi:class I SAM-dependent methyltransferase [Amphibacillus cookii]|uniref:class I SAM-dependent methyltransferase n=1 Tax=Amphibacillus cookii TaxID=767787 RepID=UPI0019598AE5|nr:class I SAM-dependent methyltransferase [Amphibacillus cookii]MBM7543036.1 site-specific DNA-methyltransferase (adenine-specific) [Amphibacillus cookii]
MSTVEAYFQQIDNLIEEHVNANDLTYMDGLLDLLNIFLMDEEEEQDLPEADMVFIKKVQAIGFERLEREQIRKTIELTTLKSMKGAMQIQHLITPDTIASYMNYLIEKLYPRAEELTIFDPVVGSANLLNALMNQNPKLVKAFGSEIDPTFIQLASLSANLQENEVEFFHQDTIQPLLLDPVDLVVADLPVGYYPDDDRARAFKVFMPDEHTYAHHLLIEQSLNYTKAGGYLIFVIPNTLFNSDQATQLHRFIQESAHVIALLQLPNHIFRAEEQAKSIFILQKKSEQTQSPKEVLMAQLPSFKDAKATENIVLKMNQWFNKEGY